MTASFGIPRVEFEVDRLRDVFDSLREGVQILSREWRYLYVNDAVAAQGRKRPEELLGRTMQECYPGIENTHIFSVLARCMRERGAEALDNEFEYADGQRAWFELRVQPCREGLVVLSLDVSERKRLEATLRQNEKLTALGQMAASVAHDLKNIFNPIALHGRQLHHHASDPCQLELLSQIESAVQTGSELVESLRAFSRQQPDGGAQVIDLNDATDLALNLCMPRIRERETIDVRRERRECPPVMVQRPGMVAGIVNLVVNALDALPASGTITLRTGASEGGSFAEVADDGPGMPPEVEKRVFEPFFTTKPQGTGLGLSMLYAFMQRHRGRLILETTPGRGTTVRLWLPATERARPSALPRSRPPSRPAGSRILVAEDDPSARAALEALLADEGFTVESASNGEEALARLAVFQPQLLLVDLHMPVMDGVSLIDHARALISALPVVLMSGDDDLQGEVAALLRDPRIQHIDKPIRVDALVALLEQALTTPEGS